MYNDELINAMIETGTYYTIADKTKGETCRLLDEQGARAKNIFRHTCERYPGHVIYFYMGAKDTPLENCIVADIYDPRLANEAEDEEYIPSATRGDYSPANPWDAPGMSIHDFI